MLWRKCKPVAGGEPARGRCGAEQVRYDDYKLVRVVISSWTRLNKFTASGECS